MSKPTKSHTGPSHLINLLSAVEPSTGHTNVSVELARLRWAEIEPPQSLPSQLCPVNLDLYKSNMIIFYFFHMLHLSPGTVYLQILHFLILNTRFKRQLKTFLFQQSAWLTLHQRLCSLGFYGALEICILLLLLLLLIAAYLGPAISCFAIMARHFHVVHSH